MARRKSDSDDTNLIVLKCLEQIEASGFSALEEFCERYPQQAETLRKRIEPLRSAGLLEEPQTDMPDRLGEFVLLDRLGGGGMGVVYRARQESLGREVALKVIRPDQVAFPDTRARFRREVEVVARLQHPGIVPVFSFGEENGTPFFAMERVHGATLHEVIDELSGRDPATLTGEDMGRGLRSLLDQRGSISIEVADIDAFKGTWSECCVTLVLQVARALDHAHGQGVLHRDLKPSNILIGSDGRALLFDFGLSSSDWVSKLTQSRSVFGSLPYMASEQITGRAADRRTDVYALGVTLYELLCLRLPFGDKSAVELREAILEGNPPSIRARNPHVPLDVATVCLKAMDRDPDRRYADAGQFARDLENALALRPVVARPAGLALRAQRWAQRNPARTVATVLALIMVLVGPAVFAVQRELANRDLRAAILTVQEEREVAELERSRAESNLDDAFDSIMIVMNRINEDSLDDTPGIDELRAELFSEGRNRLEELMLQRESYPWAERLHARLSQILAGALFRSGELSEANAANAIALQGYLGLQGTKYEAQSKRGTASALSLRALLLQAEGAATEALEVRGRVLSILSSLWKAGERDNDLLNDLAQSNLHLGTALEGAGRFDEIRPHLERALNLLESNLVLPASAPNLNNCYLNLLVSLSRNERIYGSIEAGEQYSQRAKQFAEHLLSTTPNNRIARGHLLALFANESGFWNYGLSYAECEERARQGLRLAEQLIGEFPTFTAFADRKAQIERNLLVAFDKSDRGALAADSSIELLERARERVRTENSFKTKFDLSVLLFRRTQILISLKRDREALDASSEAMQVLEELQSRSPNHKEGTNLLGLQGLSHARLVVRNGGTVDLESELEKFESRAKEPAKFTQVLASFVAEVAAQLQASGEYGRADELLLSGLNYLESGAINGHLIRQEVADDPELALYHDYERFEALLDYLAD